MQNLIHSLIDPIRDRIAPLNHTSNFRATGQLTPEEFLAAGDFLVYKFPSWSWADAASPDRRVSYFPPGKQYLVTRGVPCKRRVKGDGFLEGEEESFVRDMLGGPGVDEEGGEGGGDGGEEGDGWLKAGGRGNSGVGEAKGRSDEERSRDVRTVDEEGRVGEDEEEEEIPDMEDEEDDEEAIIRDPTGKGGASDGLRTYTLYITYTPYYRTPRLYLLGYDAASNTPLPPMSMMEDIVGDYKDKTVTLEDFLFANPPIKTASVHPCKHASVMKVLLDRADAALKLRVEKVRHGEKASSAGMEGLVDRTGALELGANDQQVAAGTKPSAAPTGDGEWEMLSEHERQEADEVAIRVDQYLVVFLKFMASVTPGIEHDFTMGV